jgi:hypothetical protein
MQRHVFPAKHPGAGLSDQRPTRGLDRTPAFIPTDIHLSDAGFSPPDLHDLHQFCMENHTSLRNIIHAGYLLEDSTALRYRMEFPSD